MKLVNFKEIDARTRKMMAAHERATSSGGTPKLDKLLKEEQRCPEPLLFDPAHFPMTAHLAREHDGECWLIPLSAVCE